MSSRTSGVSLAALLAFCLFATADIKRDVAGEQAPPAEQPKPADTGTVEGKVNFKGTPVQALYITFHPEKGEKVYTALIAPDATYTVKDVPPGKATITIAAKPPKANPNPPPQKGQNLAKDELPPPPGKEAIKPTPIPAKYGDPKTSGLTYEVKKGKQTFDIELN